MFLPPYVLRCIDALERAGFSAWAVGGCVRDAILGITPQDYDLCTEATPAQTRQVFAHERLILTGEKHGTVAVITEGGVVEITTFRTEGGYTDSRHPDWVEFVTDIRDDLSRRDFTVNAMAFSPTRGYADPFGGREDLEKGILRTVGSPYLRFTEDALRILRGIRFSVRFRLTPEPDTLQAMTVLAPQLEKIAPERIFSELSKFLLLASAGDLLAFAPIITQVIPELAPAVGFDQRTRHHRYDLFTHIAHVVEAVPPVLELRFAALLHDVGKPATFTLDDQGQGHFYGHAGLSAYIAADVLSRLRAPKALQERVTLLIGQHMSRPEPDRKFLRRWLGRMGNEALDQLLLLMAADMSATAAGCDRAFFDAIYAILAQLQAENAALSIKDLAVNGRDLMALGYAPGPALGECLAHLLQLVFDERLPNSREALLEAARIHLRKP